eukprot:gene4782-5964_t
MSVESPTSVKRLTSAFENNDVSNISKEKSSTVVEKFLKEEVLPKGHAPGSTHRSAIGKPPPNENDNKSVHTNTPKFSKPHPVYALILENKPHETSSTKKKIVIPPPSAY